VPEAGSGILADLGPHLIDQMLLLFGMPEALTADIAVQRIGGRTDDYYEIAFHYGERRVIVSSSRLVVSPRPRFALHGREGNFVKYGLDPQEPWMRAGKSANDPGFGVEDAAHHGVLTLADGTRETVVSERGDYRRYYSGIGQAIAEGRPAPVCASDAVTGLRLIELARESAAEARTLTL
jgi:scyllo-inositol 2-dehydrogenase (NADP+)